MECAYLNYVKIYSQSGSALFYLHDEIKDRMYAFKAADPGKLNTIEEFNCVVEAYREGHAG